MPIYIFLDVHIDRVYVVIFLSQYETAVQIMSLKMEKVLNSDNVLNCQIFSVKSKIKREKNISLFNEKNQEVNSHVSLNDPHSRVHLIHTHAHTHTHTRTHIYIYIERERETERERRGGKRAKEWVR